MLVACPWRRWVGSVSIHSSAATWLVRLDDALATGCPLMTIEYASATVVDGRRLFGHREVLAEAIGMEVTYADAVSDVPGTAPSAWPAGRPIHQHRVGRPALSNRSGVVAAKASSVEPSQYRTAWPAGSGSGSAHCTVTSRPLHFIARAIGPMNRLRESTPAARPAALSSTPLQACSAAIHGVSAKVS